MRRSLFSLVVLLLLLAPRAALPCDFEAAFVQGWPEPGAEVPPNVQLFAWIPFLGRDAMAAEFYDPTAFAPIPIPVTSLGEHTVELRMDGLSPLQPNLRYGARVWLERSPDVYQDFAFTVAGAADVIAPPGVGAQWSTRSGPANSCENPGWFVDVTLQRVESDDLVLYEIAEVLPNDAIVPVGAAIARTDDTSPNIRMSANVGMASTDGRCFMARAVDQQGLRGFEQGVHCFASGPLPDAGTPDSGRQDSGPSNDAGGVDASPGPAPDAGGQGLSSGDASCGCTSAPRSPIGAGWLVLALLAAWRRRH